MAASRWWASGNYFTSYKQAQRLVGTDTEWLLLVIGAALLLVWPQWLTIDNDSFLLINETMTIAIALLGLNVTTGFSGLINIGHAAFLAVGAYTFYTVMTLAAGAGVSLLNYWPLVVLASGGVGALAAAVVGLPSLRLKNLYLGLATLGFQIILDWAIRTQKFFQHGSGLNIERMNWFGSEIGRQQHHLFWYYAILASLLLSVLALRNIMRTHLGRCLVAIRENERAVASVGIAAGRVKVASFALGGFFAGVAGAYQAILFRTIEASTFSLGQSLNYLAMLVIGGLGSIKGCIFGALTLKLLDFSTVNLVHKVAQVTGGDEVHLLAALRPLLSGLFTLFFLHFQPLGLAYIWYQAKARIMLWPRRP